MEKLITGTIESTKRVTGNIGSIGNISGVVAAGAGKGTTDYEKLKNLPQIEGVTLIGNKSFAQLNMMRITNSELEELLT